MALNLDSVFFITRSAIPLLKKGSNASLINFTSIAAWNSGGPGAGIYGTSKAGVLTITRALAKESNIELFNSWKNNILLKRLGEPEEIASVIEFLVSEKASYLTGEVIQINGGQDFL